MFIVVYDLYGQPPVESIFEEKIDAMTLFAISLHTLLCANVAGAVRAYGPAGDLIQHYVVQQGNDPRADQLVVKLKN